ncbi:hypothetical protein BH20ACI2_BH20ACI2_23670 [soil metagenome]
MQRCRFIKCLPVPVCSPSLSPGDATLKPAQPFLNLDFHEVTSWSRFGFCSSTARCGCISLAMSGLKTRSTLDPSQGFQFLCLRGFSLNKTKNLFDIDLNTT